MKIIHSNIDHTHSADALKIASDVTTMASDISKLSADLSTPSTTPKATKVVN